MNAWLQLRKDEVFIDAGAHIGKYTLSSAKIVGNEGRVLAFEPHPINYQVLVRNIELNKIRNVTPINLASWNLDTTLKLFIGEVSGQHSVRANSLGFLEVKARVLDHILSGYPKINLVKIDVEGAEYETLCGLEQVISRCRPKIIIEVFSKNLEKVKKFFKKHEYNLICISRNSLSPIELVFYFVCLPESKN